MATTPKPVRKQAKAFQNKVLKSGGLSGGKQKQKKTAKKMGKGRERLLKQER